MQQQKPKVKCDKCERYFVMKSNGMPWHHKCKIELPEVPELEQVKVLGEQLQSILTVKEDTTRIIKHFLISSIRYEEKIVDDCYKIQERLYDKREEINSGLYLQICNDLLKQVQDSKQRMETYKQDLESLTN